MFTTNKKDIKRSYRPKEDNNTQCVILKIQQYGFRKFVSNLFVIVFHSRLTKSQQREKYFAIIYTNCTRNFELDVVSEGDRRSNYG